MARRICPACGSWDTTKIESQATPELEEKLKKKAVELGETSPTHHCLICGKAFGGKYSEEPTYVRKFTFFVGGYMGPSHLVRADTEEYGTALVYTYFPPRRAYDDPDEHTSVPFPLEGRWVQFSQDLLHCYVMDWNESYSDPGVVDGTHWSLHVLFANGVEISRDGSNAYPPHWEKFLRLFREYGLPHIS